MGVDSLVVPGPERAYSNIYPCISRCPRSLITMRPCQLVPVLCQPACESVFASYCLIWLYLTQVARTILYSMLVNLACHDTVFSQYLTSLLLTYGPSLPLGRPHVNGKPRQFCFVRLLCVILPPAVLCCRYGDVTPLQPFSRMLMVSSSYLMLMSPSRMVRYTVRRMIVVGCLCPVIHSCFNCCMAHDSRCAKRSVRLD